MACVHRGDRFSYSSVNNSLLGAHESCGFGDPKRSEFWPVPQWVKSRVELAPPWFLLVVLPGRNPRPTVVQGYTEKCAEVNCFDSWTSTCRWVPHKGRSRIMSLDYKQSLRPEVCD